MGWRALLLCCLTALMCPRSAFAELGIDVPYTNVQGWDVGLSNAFKSCVAKATYRDETTVWIGLVRTQESDLGAYIAVANPSWNFIEKNKDYELVVDTLGRGSWRGQFFGIDTKEGMGFGAAGIAVKFLIAFAESRGLQISVGRRKLTGLNFAGSMAALDSVMRCDKERERLVAQGPQRAPSKGPTSSEESSGTGIIISSSSHVLTNNHVVSSCSEIEVSRVGEAPSRARKVAADPKTIWLC